LANFWNASLTSVSTFAVALGVGTDTSAGRELAAAAALGVVASLADSRFTSGEVISSVMAIAALFSGTLDGILVRSCESASA